MKKITIVILAITVVFIGTITASFLRTNYQKKAVISSEAREQVPTDNIITYKNSKYGYSFSYSPKEWDVVDETNSVATEDVSSVWIRNVQSMINAKSGGEIETIMIQVEPNPNHYTAEEWLKNNYEKYLGSPSTYESFLVNEKTSFSGISARKFGTERDQYFIFENGNYLYTIRAWNKEILDTFKLTK